MHIGQRETTATYKVTEYTTLYNNRKLSKKSRFMRIRMSSQKPGNTPKTLGTNGSKFYS